MSRFPAGLVGLINTQCLIDGSFPVSQLSLAAAADKHLALLVVACGIGVSGIGPGGWSGFYSEKQSICSGSLTRALGSWVKTGSGYWDKRTR